MLIKVTLLEHKLPQAPLNREHVGQYRGGAHGELHARQIDRARMWTLGTLVR